MTELRGSRRSWAVVTPIRLRDARPDEVPPPTFADCQVVLAG
jgi:hypothetical protein